MREYLIDLGSCRPLPREEERSLWAEYYQGPVVSPQRRKEIRDLLIRSILPLVVRLSQLFLGQGVSQDDLVQAGNLGLLKCFDKFDPSRGFRLSTYAGHHILQAMGQEYLKRHTIRVPCYLVQAINTERRRSSASTTERRQATNSNSEVRKDPAHPSSPSYKNIEHARRVLESSVFHSLSSAEYGDPSYPETIPDPTSPDPSVLADLVDNHQCYELPLLHRWLSKLPIKYRRVIEERYLKAPGTKPVPAEQVARIVGCSKQGVIDIETRVLAVLIRWKRFEDRLREAQRRGSRRIVTTRDG